MQQEQPVLSSCHEEMNVGVSQESSQVLRSQIIFLPQKEKRNCIQMATPSHCFVLGIKPVVHVNTYYILILFSLLFEGLCFSYSILEILSLIHHLLKGGEKIILNPTLKFYGFLLNKPLISKKECLGESILE